MAYKTIIRTSFHMNTRFLYLGKLPPKLYATALELLTFLYYTLLNFKASSNISGIHETQSVSSPDETPGREFKSDENLSFLRP